VSTPEPPADWPEHRKAAFRLGAAAAAGRKADPRTARRLRLLLGLLDTERQAPKAS